MTGQGISIQTACRVLQVTDRGYRSWPDRPRSQRNIRHEMLAEAIANIHQASRGCYGVDVAGLNSADVIDFDTKAASYYKEIEPSDM